MNTPLQFRDWKGEMIDSPADLDTVVAALDDSSIVWSKGRVNRRKVHQVRYCHQVKQFIKSKQIPCSNKSVPTKDVAATVVDYAHKIEADLIMIMNKPGLNVSEYFTGTDAQKIVDQSPIPVMTIQPMQRESLMHFNTGY